MATIKSRGDKIFDAINIIFFLLLAVIMIYPFYNVVLVSFMDIGEYYSTSIILFPKEISIANYDVLITTEKIPRSFGISTFVTLTSTVYGLALTSMFAYAGSKKSLPGRPFFLVLVTITMFFSGGLIPSYLLIRNLGLINKLAVLIIPQAVSAWNFVVMKSFFGQLPESLEESAKLDGANELIIFLRIIIPLSKPLLATFALFYAVGSWNDWFTPMLYMQVPKMYPLALVLRKILVESELTPELNALREIEKYKDRRVFKEGMQQAALVISIVPIICIYPWLQKYFAKGVMIGSIKG